MDETESAAGERVLCEAALTGDESAWRALYAHAFDALYASVLRRAGPDRQQVDDVLQETWMIAVRKLRDFDPQRASFTAWLYGISTNVLRNRWRRRAEGAPPGEGEDRGSTGDNRLRTLPLVEQLALAMAALPDRYRAVLRAKYEDQLSVTEIAARWQITGKAVESLLTRARTAFRGAYGRLDAEG